MKKTLTTLAVAAATIITTAGAAGAAAAAPEFDIQPAALPRGADVHMAHVEGQFVVDGSIRIRIVAPRVTLLGKFGTSYVVHTQNADYLDTHVWKIRPDGSRTQLLEGPYVLSVELSDKGATLVSASSIMGRRTQVDAIDVASGRSLGVRTFLGHLAVLDVDGPRVAIGSWSSGTLIWNLKTHTTSTLEDKLGYFADLSSDRFAFFTAEPSRGGCSVLTLISSPADRVWRSCDERIETANPDGSRIATVDIEVLPDRMGTNRVIVRNAAGGKLATYNTAGYFGLAQFEDKYDLLLDTNGQRYAAIVRCDLGGCERASDLRNAES